MAFIMIIEDDEGEMVVKMVNVGIIASRNRLYTMVMCIICFRHFLIR